VQFDEKWAFVGKKQKHCDPNDAADTEQGDNWDHVAFDPAHRLVLSVVPGKRTAAKTEALVKDVHTRTGERMLDLLVSDEYPAYKPAILHGCLVNFCPAVCIYMLRGAPVGHDSSVAKLPFGGKI